MGSAHAPRMVKLTWQPEDARASVAFVGKGITYDSGGLTIKPGSSMATMKYDMGGAAAVIAATFAIAALDIPVAVTTYAPMAENMVSGRAMRPGDVLTMYGGKTVEVTNTDAEGRLILADALAMAAEEEHDAIVDVATLTGAVHRGPGREGRRRVRRRRDHRRDHDGGRHAAARCSGGSRSPRRPARPSATRARSPTCCSTTGCAGAPRSTPRRSWRVRRRQAVGPPGHRRAGLEHRRPVGPRAGGGDRVRRLHAGGVRRSAGRPEDGLSPDSDLR